MRFGLIHSVKVPILTPRPKRRERVMPLYGKELVEAIRKRCKIQPGMLVKSTAGFEINKLALVVGLSPSCKFDRDYEGAEDHIFYRCEPFDGTPPFVEYACNMVKVS